MWILVQLSLLILTLREVSVKRIAFFFMLATSSVLSASLHAATFNVTTAVEFQAALGAAEANTEDNTITMAGGTYAGPFTYSKTATANALVIQHDSNDPIPTLIEHTGGTALKIDSAFAVEVSGISFQNSILGLHVVAWGFNVDADHPNEMYVHDCEFASNRQGLFITGSNTDFSWTGNITLTNNNFHDNILYHDVSLDDSEGAGLKVVFVTVNVFPVTLTNNSFVDNQVTIDGRSGGGAYIESYGSGSSVTLTGNSFLGNQAALDGGGAYIATHYDPNPIVLKGNTFGGSGTGEGNIAGLGGGGALLKTYDDNSPITVGGEDEGEGNTFIGNQSWQGESGGGLAARTGGQNSPLSLIDNVFQENVSYWGGGFQIDTDSSGGLVTVTGNTISGNTVYAVEGGGGHIWASFGLVFENNTIIGNQSTGLAGSGAGMAIEITDNGVPNTFSHSIANNTFVDNVSATTGGGLAINPRSSTCSCDITLNANLFEGNVAATEGGGAWLRIMESATPIVITNNIFANENTAVNGGGIYIHNTAENTTAENFINNTLYGNIATSKGGGAYFTLSGISGTLNSYNNIFWTNTADGVGSGNDVFAVYESGSTLIFNNNDRGEICLDTSIVVTCDTSSSSNTIGENNVNVDPQFSNTEDIPAGLQLRSTSPIAAAGDPDAPGVPTTDYAGTSFPTPPAMGAYQSTILAGLTVSPSSKDYGSVDVGSSSSQVFTLSNTGEASVSVSSVSLSDATNFTLDLNGGDNPCSSLNASVCSAEVGAQCNFFTLEQGESCTLSVAFHPTLPQNISGELLIASSLSSTPMSIALSGTANPSAPDLSMTIQGPSGEVQVGDTVTFGIQITNSSDNASDDNSLQLAFENMEFESGSAADASMATRVLRAIRLSESASISCTGSGSAATCSISSLPANSTLALNVDARVSSAGTLSLTANLTNQAGTAAASAAGTATSVNPADMNGGGCRLNPGDKSRNYWSAWVLANGIAFLGLRRKLIH